MDGGAAKGVIPAASPHDSSAGAARDTAVGGRSAREAPPACAAGPHEILSGRPAILELIASSGDTVFGSVREKDGHNFSLFIVDRPNRAKYVDDPERCAKLFRKSKTTGAEVEFRIPDTAELPCYLVLEARGSSYARHVEVDLRTRSTRSRRGGRKVGL